VQIEIIELFFLAESMDSWFFLSFPRFVTSLGLRVREEAKNLSGGNALRLIQDPFSTEFVRNPDSCP
jgi:hypothetical protein